ncbi:MAG: hypothetical protein EA380_04425 [Phycisphaeraceae bacterium]|nr:MAG: hypothetical protein EA380_04425 [Phycisphaeraceae bacterium]
MEGVVVESTLILAYGGPSDRDVFIMVAQLVGLLLVLLVLVGIPSYVILRSKRESEQTKREIAAYVAEGSITPEQGIEMLKAMGRRGSCSGIPKSLHSGFGVAIHKE